MRLEVKVEPGVLSAPGVRVGVRSGVRLVLMLWEKPELRLCVMPEIIILVCSVVSVRPLLYTDEHSALMAKRSSRSFDTLGARRARSRRCQTQKIKWTAPFFFFDYLHCTFGQADQQRGISHPGESGGRPLAA